MGKHGPTKSGCRKHGRGAPRMKKVHGRRVKRCGPKLKKSRR